MRVRGRLCLCEPGRDSKNQVLVFTWGAGEGMKVELEKFLGGFM